MLDTITVRSVFERNNCAGRKEIFASSMEEDETIRSYYRLNHGWLPPHDKLALASVATDDELVVVNQNHITEPLLAGEFVNNLSDTHLRDPVCRCGTQMVSDGFDVHCPNANCPLTLCARLERLARTEFFDVDLIQYIDDYLIPASPEDFSLYCQPFKIITQGVFWGYPGGSLINALLQRKTPCSVASFLVPDLFRDFLSSRPNMSYLDDKVISNVQRFYGWMDETVNRRIYDSVPQNRLLHAFLWSLGLESLSTETITQLCFYERTSEIDDPITLFAFLLTNSSELIDQFHLHPLEASAIMREVSRRKYELHDIFYHYALNKQDVVNIFTKMR